jgi:excisionase family DNA binding protein
MANQVMTVQEASEWLKTSRPTIRKWILQGKIPAFRLGRFYRIRRKDLYKLFKKHEHAKNSN